MPINASQAESEEVPQSLEEDFVQIDKIEEEGNEGNGGEGFDKVDQLVGEEALEIDEIKQLMEYFVRNTYWAKSVDLRPKIALDMSIELIERDYNVIRIDNSGGILCSQYPACIPVILSEKTHHEAIYENPHVAEELRELILKANRGRCRQRFPVPVLIYKAKSICRSSTLSGIAEVFARKALDYVYLGNTTQNNGNEAEPQAVVEDVAQDEENSNVNEEMPTDQDENDWKIINDLRSADIALLKHLKVGTIVDLMVENKKIKLGIPVTSSEKIAKDNYEPNFSLQSLPFPGCEFFREFHDSNFNPEGLYFNWSQSMCDAELLVPEYPTLEYLNIKWDNYKKWDLIEITQNYIKYLVNYLKDTNSGILIHCISGWDRTPLFISLLRLSLWADGVAHKSLNAQEILFLTLSYDWMLFGHHLSDRLSKKEDILLFCFSALKYLVDDEFSILPPKSKLKQTDLKTDAIDETEGACARYEVPQLSPLTAFREESNDSMDFVAESPSSMIFPASPPEIVTSPEKTSPVPMEVCEGATSTSEFGLQSFNRTSPVEIPSSDAKMESNLSTGSWQMVSATGSIRGSDSQSDSETLSSQGSHGAIAVDHQRVSRKIKLSRVRRLFYRCYYQTLCEHHVTFGNNNTVLVNILNNLSDLVQILGTGQQNQ